MRGELISFHNSYLFKGKIVDGTTQCATREPGSMRAAGEPKAPRRGNPADRVAADVQ